MAPRELEAGVPDGALHAVAALAHARVRQPHHGDRGQPTVGEVDLDTDRVRLDSENRGGSQDGQHEFRLVQTGGRRRHRRNAPPTGWVWRNQPQVRGRSIAGTATVPVAAIATARARGSAAAGAAGPRDTGVPDNCALPLQFCKRCRCSRHLATRGHPAPTRPDCDKSFLPSGLPKSIGLTAKGTQVASTRASSHGRARHRSCQDAPSGARSRHPHDRCSGEALVCYAPRRLKNRVSKT